MRACIHRGSHQIGGSCVEVEHDGLRLLLDLGLPLDSQGDASSYLPAISGLDGRDSSLLGILISHPHLDHFGLLAQIDPELSVGMGAAARRILKAAAPFLPGNWRVTDNGWDYKSGQFFDIGPFRVTPYLVDHSAYDAYALLIECGERRLFYSGDFRAHGRKSALFDQMIAHPVSSIDALLLEGSSLGRLGDDETFVSERDMEEQFVQLFANTTGIALVHTSSQNIDRIVSVMRAAKRSERRLVIDLYTAVVLAATENVRIPQSDWEEVALFVPQSQRVKVKNNAWFDLLKKHSKHRIYADALQDDPAGFAFLFRPLHERELERADCLSGASYIYSQWEGYWARGDFSTVEMWLERNGITKHSVHTSGHASPRDLKRFVTAMEPRAVVPIHSFEPERYAELFSNVTVHKDGEWWEV